MLEDILKNKEEEILSLKQNQSSMVNDLERMRTKKRGFLQKIKEKIKKRETAIIAEIKRHSPSRGYLDKNLNLKIITEATIQEIILDKMPRPKRQGIMEVADGGIMEKDMRGGGFIPEGTKERADDVPARLSKNEFVMTADAVRAAGGGSVNKGAKRMYDMMYQLEGKV